MMRLMYQVRAQLIMTHPQESLLLLNGAAAQAFRKKSMAKGHTTDEIAVPLALLKAPSFEN